MKFKEYKGYRVYNDGNIFSVKSNKFLRINKVKSGYCLIQLSCNGVVEQFRVHRLVALLFIPNPLNKPQVNHINGIKNDNRVENLEWCTNGENVKHAYDLLGKIQKSHGHRPCIYKGNKYESVNQVFRTLNKKHSPNSLKSWIKKGIFEYI